MKVVIYSILYLFGLGENPITIHSRNDYQVMRSDWENIGKDFHKVMQQYERRQTIKN